MWDDGVLINTMLIIIMQHESVSIITLYTLNLCNVSCQLYLNNAGGNLQNLSHLPKQTSTRLSERFN